MRDGIVRRPIGTRQARKVVLFPSFSAQQISGVATTELGPARPLAPPGSTTFDFSAALHPALECHQPALNHDRTHHPFPAL